MSEEKIIEANPIDFSSVKTEKKTGFLKNLLDGITKTQRAKNQAKMNTLNNMANGLTAAHNAFMGADISANHLVDYADLAGRTVDNLTGKTKQEDNSTPEKQVSEEQNPENPPEKPKEKQDWNLNDLTPEIYKNSNITAADVINRAKNEGMSGADAVKKLRELSGGQLSDKGIAAVEKIYGKEFAESLKVTNKLSDSVDNAKNDAIKAFDDAYIEQVSKTKGRTKDIDPHLAERFPHGIIGDYLTGAYGDPKSKEAKMTLAYFIADEMGTRLRNISNSIGGGEFEKGQYKQMAADRIAKATEAHNKRYDAEMESIIKQMGFTQDEENEINATLTKLYANEALKPALQSLSFDNKRRLAELVLKYGKDEAKLTELGNAAKAMFMLETSTNPEVTMKGIEAMGGIAKEAVSGLMGKLSVGGILGLK